MDEAVYLAQIRHLHRVVEAMRLLDLHELEILAQAHGSAADRALIGSMLLALEILPVDPHG